MLKKICSIAVLICLVLSTVFISNAQVIKSTSDSDTMTRSQSDYEAQLSLLGKSRNSNDKEYLGKATETYLALSKASIRNNQSYNVEFLLLQKSKSSNNILFRLKSDEFYSKMLKNDNRSIEWDKIDFKDLNVEINNNKAVVKVVEIYEYYIKDNFDTVSKRTKEFTITFEKNNGTWLINEIKTNDPWESDSRFDYYDFDVDKEVAVSIEALKKEKSGDEVIIVDTTDVLRSDPSMTAFSYSRSKAVSYAENWYDGVHSSFGAASEDCQNFASQCVWAGLGGDISSPDLTDLPVVYSSTYGTTYERVWQHNNYCSSHTTSSTGNGWHWDNVDGFFWLISTSSHLVQGPNGFVAFNLNYADEGDVIAVDWSSTNPSLGTLDHAMVVTNTTGSSGSRNPDNIFIAAHNSQTSSAYQSLNDYTGYKSESHFATANVSRGYYYVD